MQKHQIRVVLLSSLSAALGALLVGFQLGIVASALLFLPKDFFLTDAIQGLVVGMLLIGACFGSLAGGWLADRLGRKRSLLLTSLLFISGALLLTYASNVSEILWGRFVAGLGAGIATVCVPLYIVEISPPERRGFFGSFNQLFLVFGIFLAYLIALHFSPLGNWRLMFLSGLFLASFQGACTLFIPESPCWLAEQGEKKKVKEVLEEIDVAQKELISTRKPISWKGLLGSDHRKTLWVGLGISLFQQISGVNTVIFYAPHIFQAGGTLDPHQAIFLSMIFNGIAVMATFAAVWLIDWVGRRPLFLAGFTGMFISLLLLGYSFFVGPNLSLIAIIAYLSFFSMSVGPCTWLVISEIFPESMRGRAIGISIFVNWSANYLVASSFLPLVDFLGLSRTFWFYGGICIFALWFAWKCIPETKGRSLPEIQSFWKK